MMALPVYAPSGTHRFPQSPRALGALASRFQSRHHVLRDLTGFRRDAWSSEGPK